MKIKKADKSSLSSVAAAVMGETLWARRKYGPMVSTHHGYALILEELDELWEHVKAKKGKRDKKAMRAEAIQIAAMAICFAADLCKDDYDGL